jgi:hypothetical protein
VSGWKVRHKGLTVDDVVMQKAVELYNITTMQGLGMIRSAAFMPVKGGLKILRCGQACRK